MLTCRHVNQFGWDFPAIVARHPRPWCLIGVAANGDCGTASIVDRNWNCVVGASEFLDAKHDILTMIVELVNAAESKP